MFRVRRGKDQNIIQPNILIQLGITFKRALRSGVE